MNQKRMTEDRFMIKAFLYSMAAFILLSLAGCSSPAPVAAQTPEAVHEKAPDRRSGEGLKPYADKLVTEVVASINDTGNRPRVAIATPVDVASLEHTDWLGRELAEQFVAGLHRQGYQVLEYKLTGWLEITPNGDYIYSRNWQKLAGKASVTHILSGTMSRNDNGVMVYGRLVNLRNSVVEGASDIFIPYDSLPECYRKYPRTCGDTPVYDPAMAAAGNNQVKKNVPPPRKASSGTENAAYRVDGTPATSRGNADIPCSYCNGMSSCRAKCVNPEIYPATSSLYHDAIIRDVRNQSQYDRR